jgi:pyrroloquinoline quinone biosynthesis protein B
MTTSELPPRVAPVVGHAALALALCLSVAGSGALAAERSTAGDPAPPPFLRALGTVQDGGLPHAACDGPRCRRARRDPSFRRLVASLAVVDPAASPPAVFLLDASPDLIEQLSRLRDLRPDTGEDHGGLETVDREPIDGLFLTHAHIGHYLGLAFFGYEAVHTRALPVWATPRMAGYLSDNGPWSQLVDLGNIDLRSLPPGESVRLTERLRVTAVPVPHRDELSDTVGFLVEGPSRSALYVPDTDRWDSWDPPLLERLEGVDVAVVDGTFYSADELPGRSVVQLGHPLIRTTMDLLQERVAGAGLEVYFTHLNHSNPALDPDSPEARAIRERGFHVLAEDDEIHL